MATVGRVARSHGLDGRVIVDVGTDFPEQRFQPGSEIFVRRGGAIERLTIAAVRFHRGRPVIGFAGIAAVDDAGRLAGLELRVPLERLARLPAGMFYRHDLVGCRVETRQGEVVGVVAGVEGGVGDSRLVVPGPRGEILIPLASAICPVVDVAARRIVVDPPEGLLDLNA
jgi:16S rRNA processing protein RimM